MVADNLISNEIVPLRTSDSGAEALGMMSDFYVNHLPIVNNLQLLGVISEDDILNYDVEEPIGSYSLSMSRPYVNSYDHIYEVMRLMAEYDLTVIPVVDEHKNYIGLITLKDLLLYFARSTTFEEPGSILVLEMSKLNYSLSEISRIVESENANILSSFLTSYVDSSRIDVTLKINRQNIQTIIATFQRYDYVVKASFQEGDYMDTLKDRYDSLIAYLNV